MRLILLLLITLSAVSAEAQTRTFRATPIDEEQNSRLDDLESSVSKIDSSLQKLTAAIEKMEARNTLNAALQFADYGDEESEDSDVEPETPKSTVSVTPDPTIYREVPVQTSVAAAPSYGSTGGSVSYSVAAPSYGSTGGSSQSTVSSGYYSAQSSSSIKARIRAARPTLSTHIEYAYVAPSSAMLHLKQHGYSSAELAGLSTAEAIILHDLTHGGIISPASKLSRAQPVSMPVAATNYSSRTVQRSYSGPRVSGSVSRTYSSGSACANGQCNQQSTKRRGLFGWRK